MHASGTQLPRREPEGSPFFSVEINEWSDEDGRGRMSRYQSVSLPPISPLQLLSVSYFLFFSYSSPSSSSTSPAHLLRSGWVERRNASGSFSLSISLLSSYAPETVTGEGQTLLYSIPIFKRKKRGEIGNNGKEPEQRWRHQQPTIDEEESPGPFVVISSLGKRETPLPDCQLASKGEREQKI